MPTSHGRYFYSEKALPEIDQETDSEVLQMLGMIQDRIGCGELNHVIGFGGAVGSTHHVIRTSRHSKKSADNLSRYFDFSGANRRFTEEHKRRVQKQKREENRKKRIEAASRKYEGMLSSIRSFVFTNQNTNAYAVGNAFCISPEVAQDYLMELVKRGKLFHNV